MENTEFRGIRNAKGRPKGSMNLINAEAKEKFSLLLSNNFDKLQTDLDSLEPFQRIKILLEMASFVIPKMKSTELIADFEGSSFTPVIISLGHGVKPDDND